MKRTKTALLIAVTAMAVCGAADGGEADKSKSAPAGLVKRALRAMDGVEEIVFAVRGLYTDGHYYANFGHWSSDPSRMMYAEGGSRLCKLNLRTKQVTVLLEDPEGGFRDPRVHYDGGKLLFSYRKGGTKYHHLYEINPDGTDLKQLTFGPWDDVEPAYLPDGGIIFVSSRCDRFVPCYHTQVGLLYRMDADGGNIRLLSANNVDDHRPAVLPDGRVIYTRWDYVDRAPQKFHSLWAMNPDGTDQMVLFGNTVSPSGNFFVMIDALPIPGSDKVATVFSPGHGFRENAGHVMIVDPGAGPDDWSAASQVSPERNMGVTGWARGREGFRDPYPLSEDCFLVVEDKGLLILDDHGQTEEVYQAEEMLHDPRVIRSRPRERVIPPHSNPKQTTGQLVLANVYHGRNMEGVKRGEIKKLLVLEDLPKPVSYYSLTGAISMDGTHTLHRILGTVPVEPDGSASFEVPPLRGLFFVALDEKGLAVKRMQSYTMVMPGETQGCAGCHEPRTRTPSPIGSDALMAMKRPPSSIEPVPGVPDVIDYPRDIQPVWNGHCVECHSVEKPLGHVVLTGDYNEWFTQSYYALFAYNQISDTRRYDEDGNHPPRGFGTAASPLMKKIDGSHYETKLTAQERDLVRLWIEAGATFAGTYAAYNRTDSAVAGAQSNSTEVAIGSPVSPIVERRCLSCHGSVANLGQRVEKIRVNRLYTTSPGNAWRGRVNLPKHCWNLYNLSHPDKSMILLAPLAEEAGGYGWCKTEDGQPVAVFRNDQDPDYQALLQAVRAAKARQQKAGRFDMPGFRPNEHYVRWMKRFGILPEEFNSAEDPIDVYEVDQAYWRSLWYQPDPAKYGKRQQMALAGRSSWLDGTIGNNGGVCANLKIKNPSFEEPDVRGHPQFRPGSGDVPQIPPYDWQASHWKNTMKFSQGRCSLAPFDPYDGEKKDAALAPYGPAATDGKQVAKMWLGRRSSYVGEDVKHAWLFQSLGIVVPADVGKTLELAVDVAAREHYPQSCGAGPKAGAGVTATFACDVSSENAGREVGQPGKIDKLPRDGDTKTVHARLRIAPEFVGRELVVRLSIADPEPSPGYGCHYHFDNVRCAPFDTSRRPTVRFAGVRRRRGGSHGPKHRVPAALGR